MKSIIKIAGTVVEQKLFLKLSSRDVSNFAVGVKLRIFKLNRHISCLGVFVVTETLVSILYDYNTFFTSRNSRLDSIFK